MSSGGKGYLSKNHPDFRTKLDAVEDRKRQLSPLRRKIIEHIVATGDNNTATAKALECNRVSVSKALADPYVQEEMQRQIGDRLSQAAAIAGNTLITLARSAREKPPRCPGGHTYQHRLGLEGGLKTWGCLRVYVHYTHFFPLRHLPIKNIFFAEMQFIRSVRLRSLVSM